MLPKWTILYRLHHLIRRRATGTPPELADRLDISERSLHRFLHVLRTHGAEIKYCRQRNSYRYVNDFDLELILTIQVDGEQFRLFDAGGGRKKSMISNWLPILAGEGFSFGAYSLIKIRLV